jgi:hypothetical protein
LVKVTVPVTLLSMFVMAGMVAIGTTLGLKGSAHIYKIGSEAVEHILDDMVGPNAKNLVLNFSRQMAIPKMPGKAHKLIGIFMPDFDNTLSCGLNL